MTAALSSAFEAAYWFLGRAGSAGIRLAPLHLQQLLYLAQGAYAAVHGREMMPAVFVADERGPIEPNVHAALSAAQPEIDLDGLLPIAAEAVLQGIWRHYGQQSLESVLQITRATPGYVQASAVGGRATIEPKLMRNVQIPMEQVDGQEPTRLLRSQSGRAVSVAPWLPGPVSNPATSTPARVSAGLKTNTAPSRTTAVR